MNLIDVEQENGNFFHRFHILSGLLTNEKATRTMVEKSVWKICLEEGFCLLTSNVNSEKSADVERDTDTQELQFLFDDDNDDNESMLLSMDGYSLICQSGGCKDRENRPRRRVRFSTSSAASLSEKVV